MKIPRERLANLFHVLKNNRRIVVGVFLILAVLLTAIWFGRLALAPMRRAGPTVDLASYGVSGVTLRLTYPTRLGEEDGGTDAPFVTAFARARSPEDVSPFDLTFGLSDDSVVFVEKEGAHVPGRLNIVPGYPQAMPHDLRIAHANTQLRGHLLFGHHVNVTPSLLVEGEEVPIPELVFRIRLQSRTERVIRNILLPFSRTIMPYFLLALALAVIVLIWQRMEGRHRLEREKRLSTLYMQLRKRIMLEQWEAAREKIEEIRLLAPHYRDIDRLDTHISAAETATWRWGRLYEAGVEAYKSRNWPAAIKYFAAIEEEAPYYRDVRFLKRTAILYADLRSRDRSLRLAAAEALGDVADLVDMVPLREALGDRSEKVADAAETSFGQIGLPAFDVLLEGLAHESPAVRERSYRLIRNEGQDARTQLLGALRSNDPEITEQVASLLVDLGARKELAQALLWIAPRHQRGIVKALISEGVGVCDVLIDALLEGPPERRQVILNALAALKAEVDISQHLTRALRSMEEPEKKDLLRRALELPPTGFHVSEDVPPALPLSAPEETNEENLSQEDRSWWQKLLDRGTA